MSISEPFIRRPIGTSLLAFGLFLFGATAYFFLPIAPLPQVDFPTINVSASLPGVDPATAATSLAGPLEKHLGQIAGVIEMTSVSSIGGSNVTVQFDLDKSIDSAARDVQAAINAAERDLPPNLPGPPTYRKINPADAPVMILVLTSKTERLSEVYNYANNIIAQRISQVPGISQVGVWGGAKTAVRVQVNPAQLAAMGMSMADIRTFLKGANPYEPKGSILNGRKNYMLDVSDQMHQAKDYKDLVVSNVNGTPIRLASIANVIDSTENTLQAGWFGTDRAVILGIFKQPDANVINVVDQIKALMPMLRSWMPSGVSLDVASDRTLTIRASVHDVQFTLAVTVGLVLIVMFLFLRRLSPTFIAGTTVPLALAATFGMMYLFRFSLDNISLMALTVSVGFLVDDAIVVIENITRFIEMGMEPMEAAIKGARQIGFTVVSISISLVAVFIPILMMGGIIGRLFREFGVTLSASILVSALISLTLTPTLCAKFLRPEKKDENPHSYSVLAERAFLSLLNVYDRALQWVLLHQRSVLLMTVGTAALTVWIYIIVPKGFFPQQDTGMIMGTTEAAQDISFASMKAKQIAVERVVGADPGVQAVVSFVGSAGGGPANNGRMFVTLKPKKVRKEPVDVIIARIRKKVAGIEGVNFFMQAVQDIRAGGRMSKAQYQYSLQDSNLEELNKWAPKLLAALQKDPQLKDVTSDQQFQGLQANVVVDRDAASRLGIQPDVVDATLYDAFGQEQVSVIYDPQQQYHLVLEADPDFQTAPDYLDKVYVKAPSGQAIPLSSIAHFASANTALSVNHQGQFPSVTISFNLGPGLSLGDATKIIEKASRELHLPQTIKCGFAGNAQLFQSSLASEPLLILAALVAVYIVLGMLYESLIHPLTILSTLPTAGIGALMALQIVGMDLTIVAIIGIILLIGIVKKNAIMMIDFALEAQRENGVPPEQAIYQACLVRFRPILMTTLAALFGSVPLAFGTGVGSEFRQPLGVAIIGGLILSQVLTLFTTPVVYLAMERARVAGNRFFRSAGKRIRATLWPGSRRPARAGELYQKLP